MKNLISEIEFTPVKAKDGLIGFANFVLFGSLYCGSIGVFSRFDGCYRLVYPNKKVGSRYIELYHPITNELGTLIEEEVSKEVEEVMNHDRHHRYHTSAK